MPVGEVDIEQAVNSKNATTEKEVRNYAFLEIAKSMLDL